MEVEDLQSLFDTLLNDKQKQLFDSEWQACFSRHLPGIGRFRISVYSRAGCPEFSIRLCETVVRSAAELGLPPGTGLVLTVGRMTEQKAYGHLLRAVPHIIAEHPDVCFLWVGMGPLWDTLGAEVRDMGLEEQVRFLGRAPQSTIPKRPML